jgi:hypothetical protein
MWVVVVQTVFMQVRRVIGPFSSKTEANRWVSINWNEFDVCTVFEVEKAHHNALAATAGR